MNQTTLKSYVVFRAIICASALLLCANCFDIIKSISTAPPQKNDSRSVGDAEYKKCEEKLKWNISKYCKLCRELEELRDLQQEMPRISNEYTFVPYEKLNDSPQNLGLNLTLENIPTKEIKTQQLNQNEISLTQNKFKKILLWNLGPLGRKIRKSKTNKEFSRYCKFTNCKFFTWNITNFSTTDFDAVVLSQIPESEINITSPPLHRASNQKYIFAFDESRNNKSLKHGIFDNYFNWTMSYRLSSDIKVPHMYIYDKNKTLVGPTQNMMWEENMKPITKGFQRKLRTKNKLAAIFVSNCRSNSRLLKFVNNINLKLYKYGYSVDVYGTCALKSFSIKNDKLSDTILSRDYFFYFAFEISFAVDLVTEKVLRAVQTYTVPVVYGGADYSRFLPPGSYLNACAMSPRVLADTLVTTMLNWTTYFDYFRFHNHYTYLDPDVRQNYVCDLCGMVNNDTLMNDHSSYTDLAKWYNIANHEECPS